MVRNPGFTVAVTPLSERLRAAVTSTRVQSMTVIYSACKAHSSRCAARYAIYMWRENPTNSRYIYRPGCGLSVPYSLLSECTFSYCGYSFSLPNSAVDSRNAPAPGARARRPAPKGSRDQNRDARAQHKHALCRVVYRLLLFIDG